MKKLIAIVLVCWSGTVLAQTEKASLAGYPDNPCSYGLCASSYIYLETVNFHKPRTDCKKGFGLCVRFGVGTSCQPCEGATELSGYKVTGWLSVQGKTASLHLPLALEADPAFAKTDMSTFEIDEKMLSIQSKESGEQWVKGGVYKVIRTKEDLLITLDLY